MNASKQVRIDVEAAKALAGWKSLFADEVCERAKRLAAESGQPDSVTLSHYRQAAAMALQSLADAILGEQGSNGQKEATRIESVSRRPSISEHAGEWIRRFVQQFELNFVDASLRMPPERTATRVSGRHNPCDV